MTNKPKTAKIDTLVSVPIPSADLIIYRFDQIDKQLAHFENKIDTIVQSFATKEELGNTIRNVSNLDDAVKLLTATDNRQQGSIDANRRILSIGLTLMGIIAAALVAYLGLHR